MHPSQVSEDEPQTGQIEPQHQKEGTFINRNMLKEASKNNATLPHMRSARQTCVRRTKLESAFDEQNLKVRSTNQT
jgi:hypothetical protein